MYIFYKHYEDHYKYDTTFATAYNVTHNAGIKFKSLYFHAHTTEKVFFLKEINKL